MEYRIIVEEGKRVMEEAVREAIAEGWRPLGGVSMILTPAFDHDGSQDGWCYDFAQVMIWESPVKVKPRGVN